jgi:hypothetical protein
MKLNFETAGITWLGAHRRRHRNRPNLPHGPRIEERNVVTRGSGEERVTPSANTMLLHSTK